VFPHWNGPTSPSNTLSVTNCDPKDNSQAIKFTGSGTTPGPLINSEGLCLDSACSDLSTGCVPLSFITCTSSKTQQFIYKSDKSLSSTANPGCVDLWGGSGPTVGIYECDGGSNHHWDISGSSIMTETASDLCLTSGAVQPVWVYTNADSVELLVNGASQGKKQVPTLGHVEWNTVWSAGHIEVVAYSKQGTTIGSETIETTGPPAAVVLEVERGNDGIYADKQDAALIKASIVDAKGRVVPTASNKIEFAVSGMGHLIGVGNGDPSCHEPDKGSSRSAFNGLARAIVQAMDQLGTIQITATSNGLTQGTATVKLLQPKQPIRAL